MTATIAHHLPQRLPMSPISTNTRRLSARIQKKDASKPESEHADATVESGKPSSSTGSRKRKAQYEEEEDGFAFSRVKKTRQSKNDRTQSSQRPPETEVKPRKADERKPTATPVKPEGELKKRRQRMSFSTPHANKDDPPQRRSKRLSNEKRQQSMSPVSKSGPKLVVEKRRTENPSSDGSTSQMIDKSLASAIHSGTATTSNHVSRDPSATQIALPVSDTPVIRRNKAMREGRGSRGDRRSSLGLRGRRASSLIDTGNSNALPHSEVAINDFYKHIESEQLETKRMRQLLVWCATRAMHAKPQGSEFDDTHKIMSARAIEEELLKELSNRADLSDWFERQETPVAVTELPQRPNPKNVQNTDKIAELEQRIERLRIEKEALETLLRAPAIPTLPRPPKKVDTLVSTVDKSLLAEGDLTALDFLQSGPSHSSTITSRVNHITSTLGPAVDMFADGVHKVAQYRTAADDVASRVLSICAGRLALREREGRKKALQGDSYTDPAHDMSSVLRGLSRVDR